MIKIGVIGAGYWGKKVINEYYKLSRKNADVKLIGVCDALDPALDDCQDKFGVHLSTTDHLKLLHSSDIDAVHICTPNETHYQICRDALKEGKHVLVEKPMTLGPEKAHELVHLAEKRGLVLLVGHIFRFNNALLELRKRIEEGYFGDIHHLRLQWTTLMEPPKGRDVITDLAPHPFDIINYLLDEWPIKLRCTTQPSNENVHELAYIDVEMNQGVTAHIEISWRLPGKTRRISILGSKRIVDCDCLNQEISIFEDNSSFELRIDINNTIETELRHFIDSIINNDSESSFKIENSGILGAKIVELLELSKHSLEKEDWVYVSKDVVPRSMRHSVLKDVKIGEGTKIHDQVNLYKCEIGKNCKIDSFVYIEEGVKIGNNCKIRALTFIPTGVTIEDDVFIGPNVTFTNDKYPRTKGDWKVLPTVVKRGSSIGAKSVILPGITIGENAMVGAGSVVTKDVPNNTIIVGNPAKVIEKHEE